MPRVVQQTLKPLIELKGCKGTDNLTVDDLRLQPGYVRKATNADIDSELMLHRRAGILRQLISGEAHSPWSDEGDLCFAVLNNNLVRINKNWTTTNILSLVGSAPMHFVKPFLSRVFFSNRSLVGFIENGVAYPFPTVAATVTDRSGIVHQTFKTKMLGGDLIEYFNSRLWAVQDNIVIFSDPGAPMMMDVRKHEIPVDGPVTMFHAVKDGIYVSAGQKVSFWRYLGSYGETSMPDFDYRVLLDVPARKGSAISLERLNLGRQTPPHASGVQGKVVIFSTQDGIYIGLPGGHLFDCTSTHYGVIGIEEGRACVRWYNGYRQYVFIGRTEFSVSGLESRDTASFIISS